MVVSNIFNFHPEDWGRWTHFDEHIFSDGWVQPPTSVDKTKGSENGSPFFFGGIKLDTNLYGNFSIHFPKIIVPIFRLVIHHDPCRLEKISVDKDKILRHDDGWWSALSIISPRFFLSWNWAVMKNPCYLLYIGDEQLPQCSFLVLVTGGR